MSNVTVRQCAKRASAEWSAEPASYDAIDAYITG